MIKLALKTVTLFAVILALLGSAGKEPVEQWLEEAKALLRSQLGGDPDITTVAVERVTWPNSALGCPQADRLYSQVLVEGYRVILTVAGREYSFHGQLNSPPFYCENPQSPAAIHRQ